MNETPKPTGLALRTFSLLPSSLGEAKEIAEMIASSDFAPKDYKGKPNNVIIALQMGADLGLKPMQALQNIAVINGRPSIYGDAALALVMPVLERFKEEFTGTPGTDDYTAVCIAKRKGWPDETIRTFSVADAKKASLWGKAGPWQTYPSRMLQWRARGWTLRDVGADLLLGLVLAEEAGDYPSIEGTVVASEPVTESHGMGAFNGLPEGLRDNIEKAFSTMNIAPGLRLAKINEHLSDPDVTPEDGAQRILDWARDEFARRKTGQPRAKRADNGKKKEPAPAQEPKSAGKGQTAAAEAPQEPPAKAEAPSEAKDELSKGSDLF